jgi:hypothetical protein
MEPLSLSRPFTKEFARLGVYKMNQFTREASHRLISVVIGRYRFIHGVALDAKAGVGTAVDNGSHSLRVTRVASNKIGAITDIGTIFLRSR